eukprot:CAMPEP_0168341482 /NCGR_PEP_ID=MMETSP0213-20121227/14720_1 /TAXON_ID=151035 /ORGANISM="Euplotes harpa, Strain FSP1.4" /LENGTH=95 /DNA_ID=CAMNT_0008347987 /DNA_START=31 /DNA_END=315 /DNA_ORIENTATION=-
MEKLEDEEAKETKESSADTKPIYFFGVKKAYAGFSNFYKAEFTVAGKTYPTSEHYFQAMKFYPNEELTEKVRTAKNALLAKRLGGSRKLPLRSDW